MSKGVNLLSGGKSVYPPGYELKRGVFASGSTVTIPTNIIPLTIKTYGGWIWGASSAYGVGNSINCTLGQLFYVGNASRQRVDMPTVIFDVETHYGMDYEKLKTIRSFYNSVGSSAGEGGSWSTIQVVKWLEKIGGGLNLLKNLFYGVCYG